MQNNVHTCSGMNQHWAWITPAKQLDDAFCHILHRFHCVAYYYVESPFRETYLLDCKIALFPHLFTLESIY